MSFDNAYEALTEDGHWAFGTGFSDPLSGMEMTPPTPP